MGKRITIIEGHPDPNTGRFHYALAEAYGTGAQQAGHELRRVRLSTLDFPLLRSKHEWEEGTLPAALVEAQEAVRWADHLIILYPLWLGSMPALLKAFLEQVLRPGFAVAKAGSGSFGKRLLAGKSARIVVTMGMPALFYRWYFRAHSLKSLERNILKFCGISPVRESLIGLVENRGDAWRKRWIEKMRMLGHAGR